MAKKKRKKKAKKKVKKSGKKRTRSKSLDAREAGDYFESIKGTPEEKLSATAKHFKHTADYIRTRLAKYFSMDDYEKKVPRRRPGGGGRTKTFSKAEVMAALKSEGSVIKAAHKMGTTPQTLVKKFDITLQKVWTVTAK